ncbi:MAG: TadE/TadG family type IV pilus assembly protein [Candidatus Limnocylindria bacterium]
MRPALRGERGTATLETTLMVAVLVPLLFSIIEFGDAFQRWLAQDAATVQAARYAAELGGDGPEVRALLDDALRANGIDPSRATVRIEPARVGWRQPIRVTVRSDADIAIPFVLSTTVPLRSTAVARGEVNR